MGRKHGEKGEFVETVTLDDVRAVFDEVPGPVVLSADVADRCDCSRETARRKLKALHERGELEQRKVARRVIYWRTADAESGREHTETRGEASDDQAGGTPASTTATAESARDSADSAPDLDAVLADWRPGRSAGRKRDQQRAAGRATLEFLRERGSATAAEFREYVEPDHSVTGQSPGTWWKKTAREALQRAREADLVTFKDGVKEWRWIGDSAAEDAHDTGGPYDPSEEFN